MMFIILAVKEINSKPKWLVCGIEKDFCVKKKHFWEQILEKVHTYLYLFKQYNWRAF